MQVKPESQNVFLGLGYPADPAEVGLLRAKIGVQPFLANLDYVGADHPLLKITLDHRLVGVKLQPSNRKARDFLEECMARARNRSNQIAPLYITWHNLPAMKFAGFIRTGNKVVPFQLMSRSGQFTDFQQMSIWVTKETSGFTWP